MPEFDAEEPDDCLPDETTLDDFNDSVDHTNTVTPSDPDSESNSNEES